MIGTFINVCTRMRCLTSKQVFIFWHGCACDSARPRVLSLLCTIRIENCGNSWNRERYWVSRMTNAYRCKGKSSTSLAWKQGLHMQVILNPGRIGQASPCLLHPANTSAWRGHKYTVLMKLNFYSASINLRPLKLSSWTRNRLFDFIISIV